MDFLRILFTAVLPVIIIAFIIYKVDRYDKEPIKLLLLVILLGALSVIPAIIAETILKIFTIVLGNGIIGLAYDAFIRVALVEEFCKWLVVIIVIYKRPEFDEPIDGIVYCVFASLGFAAIENIGYVFSNYVTSPNIALYRGILSVPAHALFGVSMGYFLSLAKYAADPVASRRYYSRSLWIPVLFHGIYDFILFIGNPLPLLIFVPFVIFLWVNGIKKLKEFAKIAKAKNEA